MEGDFSFQTNQGCSFFLCSSEVIVGMVGPVKGGGGSLSSTFTWHPILMSIGFPCLMMMGRWAYVTDALPRLFHPKLPSVLSHSRFWVGSSLNISPPKRVPCFCPLPKSQDSLGDKEQQRSVHGTIMALATLAAVAGYLGYAQPQTFRCVV